MRLTRASTYALHALAHLAAAGDGRPVAARHIARARGIPAPFLRIVLRPLVSARILRAVGGQRGGFRLGRPAAEVTLLEVVEAVDGPLRGEAPVVSQLKDGLDARFGEICAEVAILVRRRLGRVRLADLAGGR
jgi:Rrf2 family protein